jgi:hypothetical protein
MRLAEDVAYMGQKRGTYRVLVGKRVEKRPIERPRRTWGNNIKMDLRETGWSCGLGSSGSG